MNNISNIKKLPSRDIYFFRQRLKNKIFQSILAYFNDLAKEQGLTKKDLATLLNKDPAQITRWFSGPKNWTLDTISDLLLAMDAEIKHDIVSLHDNEDQVTKLDSAKRAAFPCTRLTNATILEEVTTSGMTIPHQFESYTATGRQFLVAKGGALDAWFDSTQSLTTEQSRKTLGGLGNKLAVNSGLVQ